MLATLMLGIQRFQFAQIGGKLHLHEYERIAGCGSLHFRRVGGLALDIVNHALQQVPLAELLNGSRLVLDGLPHPGVIGLLCGIVVNAHREIVGIALIEQISLPDDAPVPLLQVGRTPRRIQMMRGHQPFLDIHARPHFAGGTKQNADVPGVHVGKEFCLADIGVGLVDEGNFFCRNPPRNELVPYIVIHGKAG